MKQFSLFLTIGLIVLCLSSCGLLESTAGDPVANIDSITIPTPFLENSEEVSPPTRTALVSELDDDPIKATSEPSPSRSPGSEPGDALPTVEATEIPCEVITEWPEYPVIAGDTLARIARRADTSVSELAEANCLTDPNLLRVGQIIYVPVSIDPTKTPIATPSPVGEEWVRYSDRIYQVSFEHPSSWEYVGHGLITKLMGDDGFVQLAAGNTPYDLYVATDELAHSGPLLYGSTPVIEPLTLSDGRRARLIFPSADQPETYKGQALLVTQYGESMFLGSFEVNFLTLAADEQHIRQIASTLELPDPPDNTGIDQFEVRTEEMASGGKRVTFTWHSFGTNRGMIVSGTAQRFAPWWPVVASGEMTVDIAGTLFPNPTMTLQVYNDISGREVHESVIIAWPCQYEYFFSQVPERCPKAAALVMDGAYQPFEQGFMIWLQRPNSVQGTIYAFVDSGQAMIFTDNWSVGDPAADPNLVPPDGLFQPVRGFGQVWREQTWLREQLGWATFQESPFKLTYQAESRESVPGVVYLTRPDGAILRIMDTKWQVVAPGGGG